MGWEQWILSERAGKAEMLALGLREVCIWQVEQGLPEKGLGQGVEVSGTGSLNLLERASWTKGCFTAQCDGPLILH